MKTDQQLTDSESLKWNSFDCFLGISSLKKRLKTIEEWTELPFIKRDFTGKHQPHTLLCQHEKMLALLNDSYAFHQHMLQGDHALAKIITRERHEVKLESEILGYQPEYLNEEETLNPDQYLRVLDDEETLKEYQEYLDVWLSINLSETTDESVCYLMSPVASMMKKLTEASWLINYRIGKNSEDFLHDQVYAFKDTSPILLNNEETRNPYSVLLDFYGGASLNAYRRDLQDWFRASMTDGQTVQKGSNTIFFHEQLTQLMQAAYLIVKHEIPFDHSRPYSGTTITFAAWIRAVDDKHPEISGRKSMQYEPTILNQDELINPLQSLSHILTLDQIKQMRYGLKEWLYYGFTSGDYLGTTDAEYGFELYDQLLKFIELCFVLVVPQKFNEATEKEDYD